MKANQDPDSLRWTRDITDELKIISDSVYNYRKEHGVSQQKLADMAGIDCSLVCFIENMNGRSDLALSVVLGLSQCGVLELGELSNG